MSPDCSARDAWVDGTLDSSAKAAFETHLGGCADCQAAVATWKAFGAGLVASYPDRNSSPSPGEVARLVFKAGEPNGFWRRFAVPGALAAAAVAALVAVVVGRGFEPPPWQTEVIASAGATVSPGAAETTASGRAVLQLGEDTLGVGATTRVEIERADRKATRLFVARGTLAAHVDSARAKRDFRVRTKHGEVRVVGTVFRVSANDESLTVEVLKGEVEVLPWVGGVIRVNVGRRLILEHGAPRLEASAALAFGELEREYVEPAKVSEEAIDLGGVVASPEESGRSPQVAIAPIGLWRSRAARGECAQVTKEAKRFLSQKPFEAAAWLVIGDCQRRAGKVSAAIDSYLEAGKQKGPDAETGLFLAASLIQDEMRKPARALKVLETLVGRAPARALHSAALVRQARALRSLGQTQKARETLDQVIRQFAETPSAAEAARLRDPR